MGSQEIYGMIILGVLAQAFLLIVTAKFDDEDYGLTTYFLFEIVVVIQIALSVYACSFSPSWLPRVLVALFFWVFLLQKLYLYFYVLYGLRGQIQESIWETIWEVTKDCFEFLKNIWENLFKN